MQGNSSDVISSEYCSVWYGGFMVAVAFVFGLNDVLQNTMCPTTEIMKNSRISKKRHRFLVLCLFRLSLGIDVLFQNISKMCVKGKVGRGTSCCYDVVIDAGNVIKNTKRPVRRFLSAYISVFIRFRYLRACLQDQNRSPGVSR